MKKLIMYRRSTPEKLGYPDKYVLFDSDSSHPIDSGECGTNPKPCRKRDKKPWDSVFAQIAPGTYPFTCDLTHHHKPCLVVNNGKQVTTTNSNVNHDWDYYATDILVHKGDNQHNRGSTGCCTIEPSKWDKFIGQFKDSEKGTITIKTDSAATPQSKPNIFNSLTNKSQQQIIPTQTPTIGDIFLNNLAKTGYSMGNIYGNKAPAPSIGNMFLDNLKHPGYSLDDIKNGKAKISFVPY
jgi:hypothetical protein